MQALRRSQSLLLQQIRKPVYHGMPRAFAASSTAEETLVENYKKVAPNMDAPSTAASYIQPRPAVPATIPAKLTLNFIVPHEQPFTGQEVDSVIIPASTGQMGVLPGHVPSIAMLKPGLLSVLDGTEEKKFFLSSGFAFVHDNSVVDICAVEAVPLDQLDVEEVKKGLAAYTAKLATAVTDLEKAEAQIGVDVHSAMGSALGV